ncbi:hypothetical protein BC937DRAFT_89534 [Endogone sp. FLAS-F59071]|nr:hypothetical protein BC937DRAFT_89534 [Endogone sp. FLAS-F59071]|eukprot:RUS22367.1 hypothetical protein BC937DRAFT_89534 [Endogone sp. FLAS-F59071]
MNSSKDIFVYAIYRNYRHVCTNHKIFWTVNSSNIPPHLPSPITMAKNSLKQSATSFSLTRLFVRGVFLAGLLALFSYLDTIKDQFYVFDPVILQQLAQENIAAYDGNNTQALITNLVADLDARYPGHINLKQEWVFNNAGGAMGAMYIIHASITEYVIIFGTPVGTEGHTGRYFADDYFIILEGEQWAFAPGQLKREVYLPGDMHHLARGDSQQYKIPEHAWALEYARGWIPTMLPFGIADTLFSTLDLTTLYHLFRLYGKSVVGQLFMGKI